MDLDGALKELSTVLEEHRLAEARWESADWGIVLRRATVPLDVDSSGGSDDGQFVHEEESAAPTSKGTPVSSPMTGVFYGASSPSAEPFTKEGDNVTAGQVVGLIEAMKVFNEITAPVSGTVLKIVAQSGDVVNPGEPLLFIG